MRKSRRLNFLPILKAGKKPSTDKVKRETRGKASRTIPNRQMEKSKQRG